MPNPGPRGLKIPTATTVIVAAESFGGQVQGRLDAGVTVLAVPAWGKQ
jgi:hypothetical protein